jgi:hypothetical protein
VKLVSTIIDIKRVIKRKLFMAIGDARLLADGKRDLCGQRPARRPVHARAKGGGFMTMRASSSPAAGIVSCIGNDLATVDLAPCAKAGPASAMPEIAERGLRSQVAGVARDRSGSAHRPQAACASWVMPPPTPIALADAIAQSGLHPSRSRTRAPA